MAELTNRSGVRARHGNRDGFTLLEVMIAVGILAFGLLTLAAMQLEALTQGSAGRHTADASATARTYLEQAQRIPWAVLTASAGAGWVAPTWAGAPGTVNTTMDSPNGGSAVEHSYAVTWRVINILDGGGVPNPCLRDVEVRVTWTEENIPNKRLDLVTRRFNHGDPAC